MFKALVIGCGNIGALYDWDNDKILTHAKAFHNHDQFSFSVFDLDKELAKSVGDKYGCEVIERIEKDTLASFDCVSVCTPTSTHYDLLQQILSREIKLVICEKPVANDSRQLYRLKELYYQVNSKVIVNYIRRFQPAFASLKQFIAGIAGKESLTNIAIRYQRGFLNNCGHALDTIDFLLGDPLELEGIKINNMVYDQFPDDPTLSIQATSKQKTNIVITGLSDIKFSFFEIDIYFEYHYIAIKNAGAVIRIYKAEKDERRFLPLQMQDAYSQDDCLKDYMKHVIEHAYKLLSGKETTDNFSGSVDLNLRMLKYLNQ
ncbi:Gfo/Idh/MocA family protein [Longitalea arenae]|uniref:Gfo/Idh/MocA family protein n=1 Tax=Longitalea arenae TaxID=2812558 RepID=UPI0019673610|nr:Gfo/Idh/MocA family oxidoreductase [Longitalea arenae]